MYLCYQYIICPVLPVLPCVSPTAGWLLLLFCTLIGGTTTVRTVGLLGSVSGATHATRGSQFLLLSAMKRRSVKGLLLWPEASEAGELSTVSQPLSCSSSDILQEGEQWGRKLQIWCGVPANVGAIKTPVGALFESVALTIPVRVFAGWVAGLGWGWRAGAERAVWTAQGADSLHTDSALTCLTICTTLTPVCGERQNKTTFIYFLFFLN